MEATKKLPPDLLQQCLSWLPSAWNLRAEHPKHI